MVTQILAADWPAPLASADIDELASVLFPVSICLFYIPFNTGALSLDTGWTLGLCTPRVAGLGRRCGQEA